MGKCIDCGCETDDMRCRIRKDKDGGVHDDYMCEDCAIREADKEWERHRVEFKEKVLPYLLENEFKVVVTSWEGSLVEEYPVKDHDVMYCVGLIRDDMKARGYQEIWIDVSTAEYNGVRFELVDYLCYEPIGDRDSDNWISYNLELVGKGGLSLKKHVLELP